jgi:hypothetical protein
MYFILRGKVKLFLPQNEVTTHYPPKRTTLPDINYNQKSTIDEGEYDVFLTQKTSLQKDNNEDKKKINIGMQATIQKNEKIKELQLLT